MEPYGSNRAEVGRWLGIAEKLLAGGDLVGSKTFAIRARDSDPSSLDAADQILAVVDTLIAGEKRINNQHDWYAILELARYTRDPDIIAAQYRRLAILLNPHRNRLAFADQAFKLVSDAWSVLSNPPKKTLYDNELVLYSKLDSAIGREQQQHHDEQSDHHFEQPTPQAQQQQQHAASRKSPRTRNSNKDKNVAEESEIDDDNNDEECSTFWTACPYCYNMYEFPGVYEECSLRCMNCHRAFHGTKIFAPPPIIEGKEAYFCCWGFYPLGISMSKLDKNKGGVSSWNPFSPIFASPQLADRRNEPEDNVNAAEQSNVNVGVQKNVNPRKGASAPRIYIDDQDVYVEISESGEESGDEWSGARQKKKAKNAKGKSSTAKNVKKPQGDKAKTVRGVTGGDNLQGGYVTQQFMGTPNVPNAETSRKAAVNSAKKQTGKAPKEWGRLDLNVEFSNEVEEPAPGMSHAHGHRAAHGEEDGIEGIGFFEGLDEFLSSLPILKG
ncbi:hypothetical protein CsSME_00048117 [Camellia sinensis var. sinensis]